MPADGSKLIRGPMKFSDSCGRLLKIDINTIRTSRRLDGNGNRQNVSRHIIGYADIADMRYLLDRFPKEGCQIRHQEAIAVCASQLKVVLGIASTTRFRDDSRTIERRNCHASNCDDDTCLVLMDALCGGSGIES